MPAPADSASGRSEEGPHDPAEVWARLGSAECGVQMESGPRDQGAIQAWSLRSCCFRSEGQLLSALTSRCWDLVGVLTLAAPCCFASAHAPLPIYPSRP